MEERKMFEKNVSIKDKQTRLSSELKKLSSKEKNYVKTIRDLKEAIAQQKQLINETKNENRALIREIRGIRHQREFEEAIQMGGLAGADADLLASLALSGELNSAEIRYQQRLWEHRHCQNGRCIHSDMNYEELLELGEQIGNVNVGLTPEDINRIPKEFVNEANCSICQSEILNELARKLPCSHLYHPDCIDTWLTNKKQCPICWFEVNIP